ncbi:MULTISPECIES: hypothetical protein [Niallia]|uniref:Uncharacterized protein n=1 Tax=Niallia alba TaxID=2729105 RepID=A0A7Y0K7H3_9BACI|nr:MULTISPECIES: hypothetical protein [Niallia]NMO76933.1 hypothetical protein [Niallia alba]UTI40133.1 hypothetical protein NKG37_14395 [Niallia sp. RD1]
MANIVIYYNSNKGENTQQAVEQVNNIIHQLEKHHVISGVYIDNFDQSIELMDLLNSPLKRLDYIYINKPIKNEFDKELIYQLSKTEHFKLRYFNEI